MGARGSTGHQQLRPDRRHRRIQWNTTRVPAYSCCTAKGGDRTDFAHADSPLKGQTFISEDTVQKIQYPDWDLRFCHEYEYDFALLNYLFAKFDLQAEFDCVLFMEKVPQVWGASWLFTPDASSLASSARAGKLETA